MYVVGERTIEGAEEAIGPSRFGPAAAFAAGDVFTGACESGDLAFGVDSGIGAASADELDTFAHDAANDLFDHVLNGAEGDAAAGFIGAKG